MLTFIVESEGILLLCPVNDKPRSPVMPAELHHNLAWSIFLTHILPRSRLEWNNARPTGYS